MQIGIDQKYVKIYLFDFLTCYENARGKWCAASCRTTHMHTAISIGLDMRYMRVERMLPKANKCWISSNSIAPRLIDCCAFASNLLHFVFFYFFLFFVTFRSTLLNANSIGRISLFFSISISSWFFLHLISISFTFEPSPLSTIPLVSDGSRTVWLRYVRVCERVFLKPFLLPLPHWNIWCAASHLHFSNLIYAERSFAIFFFLLCQYPRDKWNELSETCL